MIIKPIKNLQKGFTLIELMITVAIVGILAAVALPAYQDYTIKAQVSEAFPLAAGLKVTMTEYYGQNNTFGTDQTTYGLAASGLVGKYVGSVKSTGSLITITMGSASPTNAKVYGKTILMNGADNGSGNLVWTCGAGTIDVKYLPSTCI